MAGRVMQLFGLFFRRLPYPSISHSLPVFSNVCLVVSVKTVLKVWVHCFIFYFVFNASQTCELNNDKQQGTKKKVFVFSQTSTTRSQETQTNNEPLRPGTEKKNPKINQRPRVKGEEGERGRESFNVPATLMSVLFINPLFVVFVFVYFWPRPPPLFLLGRKQPILCHPSSQCIVQEPLTIHSYSEEKDDNDHEPFQFLPSLYMLHECTNYWKWIFFLYAPCECYKKARGWWKKK